VPFASPEQEIWMREHLPEIYRRWLKKYGHAPGFNKKMRQSKRRTRGKRKKRK
jgi:hypothetical protein